MSNHNAVTAPECKLIAKKMPPGGWFLVEYAGTDLFGEGWSRKLGKWWHDMVKTREVQSIAASAVDAYWIINGKEHAVEGDYHVLIARVPAGSKI